MNSWIKLALRNLLRNKRRSAVTILAVALGFAAVNVFGGFTTYMFVNLEESFIYAQGNGHLQIVVAGKSGGPVGDMAEKIISGDTLKKIEEIAAEDDRIDVVAGRLDISGTIDTGDSSTIFIGRAIQPSRVRAIYDASKTLKKNFEFPEKGEPLSDDNPYQIIVAYGLQDLLSLEQEDSVVLLSKTIEGQVNVVDATVNGPFVGPEASLDDKLIMMPLELAQELLFTDGVTSVGLLLKHPGDLEAVQQMLQTRLSDASEELDVLLWSENSEMYRLTKGMFSMIFGIVFFILILIVTMSVTNTMGMAILERITEIGTLRALGLKQNGVIYLFGLEGGLLGVLGSLFGVIVTVAVVGMLWLANPTWTPPTIGREVPLEIGVDPRYLMITFAFLAILTLVAAILPARRAARGGIVEALGHV